MCLIFVVRGVRRKFFHAEFFPNYGMYSITISTVQMSYHHKKADLMMCLTTIAI